MTVFWRLESTEDTDNVADWDDEVDLEQIICPLDPGHQRAGRRIGELRIVLANKAVPDFVWINELLIQDHVLASFKEQGFTDFEVRPATARWRRPAERSIPTLWEVVVTGWAGMAPQSSGIRLIKACSACGLLRYSGFSDPGKIVDQNQWDGSDFFIVWPMPKFILVSDRVADFVRSMRYTGVRFVRPEGIEPCNGFGPGRLRYWMPEARARELGEPLGIY